MSTIVATFSPVNNLVSQKSRRTRLCEFCGYPLAPYNGKGRPPVFHPECADLSKKFQSALNRLENFHFTGPARSRIRSALFYAANNLVPPFRDSLGRFTSCREGGAA